MDYVLNVTLRNACIRSDYSDAAIRTIYFNDRIRPSMD